jgi:starch synthase/alpha-amylase
VAHDTGGIHDTISDLDVENDSGNGFLFKTFDANGLLWAVNQAMNFYNLPHKTKAKQIKRVMTESAAKFTHAATARQYIDLYEKMLRRPLIVSTPPDS